MTPKTLRQERIEKFTEILVEFKVSPYDYSNKPQLILPWLDQLAERLADAAPARTERATTEKPDLMDAIIESGQRAQKEHDALIAFEAAFKIENGNIPWFKNRPEWTRLRKKLVEKYLSDPDYFKKYAVWQKGDGKYVVGSSPQKMRQDPAGFLLALDGYEAATIGEITHKSAMLEETQKKIESEDWRKRA